MRKFTTSKKSTRLNRKKRCEIDKNTTRMSKNNERIIIFIQEKPKDQQRRKKTHEEKKKFQLKRRFAFIQK